MNTIILAAGLGSRLGEYTKKIPKAMISINGKILIDSLIQTSIDFDCKKIFIVTGYKSEVIENHVKEKYDDRISLIKNYNYRETNSAFSWLLAAPYIISDDCLHFNCDITFSKKATLELYNEFKDSGTSVIATRNDLELNDKMEQIATDEENHIRCCLNKYKSKLEGKAYGMCIFNKNSNKDHFNILTRQINEGNTNENFFYAIRTNCLNKKYKAVWFDKINLHEYNYIEDLKIEV